jgi:hypothetical protein
MVLKDSVKLIQDEINEVNANLYVLRLVLEKASLSSANLEPLNLIKLDKVLL